jgi:hypothetical protein
MDGGFSAFKTNFASGGFEFAYNQTELGWRLAMTDRVVDAWYVNKSPRWLHLSFRSI